MVDTIEPESSLAGSNSSVALIALSSSSPSVPATSNEPRIEQLVLDAAPLLAQLPLRGMAKKYYIPPSVLSELKDKKAREHLEFLKIAGLDLEVREAGPEALARVIAFAKQTGDYAVLSRPDLAVLALACALEVERHGTWRIRETLGGKTGQQRHEAERLAKVAGEGTASTSAAPEGASEEVKGEGGSQDVPAEAANGERQPQDDSETAIELPDEEDRQGDEDEAEDAADEDEIAKAIERLDLARASKGQESSQRAGSSQPQPEPHDDDDDDQGWTTVPSSSRYQPREEEDFGGSDGEGEWITSDNITAQKHRDLGLVTDEAMTALRGEPAPAHPAKGKKNSKANKGKGKMTVATMTADYAVQNVLLQMGMALVSTEGMRIDKVRSWVLRCHACFKICKDSERKFCPSCGNATLIRTSVTSAAPGAKDGGSVVNGLQLHLKKNFQYKTRGTRYSIPLPKAGSTTANKDPKNAPLILREDQAEWQRGLAKEKVRKHKEQKALDRALEKGKDTISARYEDPDWLPGMILTGDSRKEWTGLPDIGAGRRNPNQAKHGRRRK